MDFDIVNIKGEYNRKVKKDKENKMKCPREFF